MSDSSRPWVAWARPVVARLPFARYRSLHALGSHFPGNAPFTTTMYKRELRFVCDLRDAISREVFFTGCYEPQETAIIQRLLAPGMTFLDVGANWGYHSLLSATMVGPSGRVVSVEPHPTLAAQLRENVAANNLTNVTVEEVAVHRSEGTLDLLSFADHDGNFGLSRVRANGTLGATGDGTIKVAAEAIDSLLERLGVAYVDVMKIDVEGGEAAAIDGMTATLHDKRVGVLLVELHPGLLEEHHETAESVIDRLGAAEYSGFSIDHTRSTTRRASYRRSDTSAGLLNPVADGIDPLWPHTVWFAPDADHTIFSARA